MWRCLHSRSRNQERDDDEMRGGKREDKKGEGLGAAGGNTRDHKKGTERGAMGRNTVRGGAGEGAEQCAREAGRELRPGRGDQGSVCDQDSSFAVTQDQSPGTRSDWAYWFRLRLGPGSRCETGVRGWPGAQWVTTEGLVGPTEAPRGGGPSLDPGTAPHSPLPEVLLSRPRPTLLVLGSPSSACPSG